MSKERMEWVEGVKWDGGKRRRKRKTENQEEGWRAQSGLAGLGFFREGR